MGGYLRLHLKRRNAECILPSSNTNVFSVAILFIFINRHPCVGLECVSSSLYKSRFCLHQARRLQLYSFNTIGRSHYHLVGSKFFTAPVLPCSTLRDSLMSPDTGSRPKYFTWISWPSSNPRALGWPIFL